MLTATEAAALIAATKKTNTGQQASLFMGFRQWVANPPRGFE